MPAIVTSFVIGMLFAIGLNRAEMTDPARVIGFLDIAGHWDSTLMWVMGGALAVTMPLFPWIQRRKHSLLGAPMELPTARAIDGRLLIGAALFGIGWGIGGFCPGPALANLSTAAPSVLLFVAAMAAGQWLGFLGQRKNKNPS